MPDPVLHYIYDPLCGWCYAAAPLIDAVRGSGMALSLHAGGLFATPTRIEPTKAAYIRESDARIAELTGQRFGADYLDGLLVDPATTLWSRPPIAAILAAGLQRAGGDLAMLHAIQLAHYVDGRRVVEPAVLSDLAVGIGLDGDAVALTLDDPQAIRHIQDTQALMDRAGVRGFPGFLLERPDGWVRLAHDSYYGRPAEFVAALATADSTHTR